MSRRHPIVPFDPDLFAPFFGAKISELKTELLQGGACNSNYLVQQHHGTRYVCRIHSRGNPAQEKYVADLARNVVPCPDYLWANDRVSVQSFIEGEHFQPTASLVRDAGHIIARLSKIRLSRSGVICEDGTIRKFEGWPSFAEGLRNQLRQESIRNYLDDATVASLSNLITRTRAIWEDFEACHSLVHGDFNSGNLLVMNDAITGVLDWEFAHSGCFYMDVGNLTRHLDACWQ
ncbi:MAG: phosphotransferase, partial [Candidatus Methylacidiphilales bacterium]